LYTKEALIAKKMGYYTTTFKFPTRFFVSKQQGDFTFISFLAGHKSLHDL